MIPSVGRIVHYVVPNDPQVFGSGLKTGDHVAAIITRVWDPTPTEKSIVQLTAFTDAANDRRGDGVRGFLVGSSVHQDSTTFAPGTWHQPETAAHHALDPVKS